jgi:undecaprenyl-diphosphatase
VTNAVNGSRLVGQPATRLLLGVIGIGVTGLAVRRNRVGRHEVAVFRAVNRLPDALFPPGWVVMQAGTLAAAPVAAAAAYAAGRPRLGARLLLSGSSAWMLGKLLKHGFQRPRPTALVAGTRVRGREATGLGYVSGHAGVAVALAAAILPEVGPRARAVVAVTAPLVGMCRIYVGAHLPLDVVGGAAAGLAVDAVVAAVVDAVGDVRATPSR